MKTINVSISDRQYNRFGLKSTTLAFTDLIDIIRRELAKQRLEKSIELAEKHGISTMTMEEITKEVKAARKEGNAKNRS